MSAISVLRPDHQHPHMIGSDWMAIDITDNFHQDPTNDNRWTHWTNLNSSILEPLQAGMLIEGYIIWSRPGHTRTNVRVTKVNRKSWKCVAEDDGQEYTIKIN